MDRDQRPSSLSLLNLILLLLVAGFVYWRTLPSPAPRETIDPTAEPRVVTARGDLAEDEKTSIELFKAASPSVVNIQSISLRRDPFSFDTLKIPTGSGSGFVWDEKGRIVTNYHVVKGARAIKVTLADHSVWDAHMVRYDSDKDLAVLWTNAPSERLRPLPVGESNTLKVGQKVFAIGNPFGLDQTLTTGIISALGRELDNGNGQALKGLIQTDAAINPGNSGGPLLDSAGRLIGVNTAIISPSGTSAGIGFAIAVDEVNRVVPRLIRHEKPVRPSIGIVVAPDQILQKRGIEGVLILSLIPGGPAEQAGLQPTLRDETGRIRWGDIILAVNDRKVTSTKELFSMLEEFEVGQEVTLKIYRGGEILETKIKLSGDARGSG